MVSYVALVTASCLPIPAYHNNSKYSFFKELLSAKNLRITSVLLRISIWRFPFNMYSTTSLFYSQLINYAVSYLGP